MEKTEDPRLTQAKKDVAKLKEQLYAALKSDVSIPEASKAQALPKIMLKMKRHLKGHLAKVNCVQWTSDKSHLVSAAQDGKVLVWDAMTQNKEHALSLRCNWVLTCAYSSTGGLVAAGGLDNNCLIFNLRSRENKGPYRELQGHTGYISCCRFLNDREILTSSGDCTCVLWDIESNTKKTEFNDCEYDISSLCINPTEETNFISGGVDKKAKLWDIRTGKCVQNFHGHTGDVNSVAFLGTGKSFVTGSEDQHCKLFDIRAGGCIADYHNETIAYAATSVDLSHSGRLLFAAYDHTTAYIWDTLKVETVGTIGTHDKRINCISVSTDGTAVATASWDTFIKIWA